MAELIHRTKIVVDQITSILHTKIRCLNELFTANSLEFKNNRSDKNKGSWLSSTHRSIFPRKEPMYPDWPYA
jgi:hypothetical protein